MDNKGIPTQGQLAKLWIHCTEWVKKNKPRCAESIYQVDAVFTACPELAEDVCEIVGYYEGD